MNSRTFVGFSVFLVILSTFSTIATPSPKSSMDGINNGGNDRASCKGKGVLMSCQQTIDSLWESGKIKSFNTVAQTEDNAQCTITWKSTKSKIQIKSKNSLINAFKKIDDACQQSGHNVHKNSTSKPKEHSHNNGTKSGTHKPKQNSSSIGVIGRGKVSGKIDGNTVDITVKAKAVQ
uniref:Secreted protein n=1 Tax=Phakopsora pachyrhizi TaxID=170000 RepID=A0A0S1MK61_PHAPC